MKNNKLFLLSLLPFLAGSLMTGCTSNNNDSKSSEPEQRHPVLEGQRILIGDTVKLWKDERYSEELPFGCPLGVGEASLETGLGIDDTYSIRFDINGNATKGGYVSNEAVEKPYFTEFDVDNGDIVSIWAYVPEDGNIQSLQLVLDTQGDDTVEGNKIEINDDNKASWIRLVATYDSTSPLSEIAIDYEAITEEDAVFYIDDIEVIYGEHTAENDYEFNDESLCRAYADYIKIGTCMSTRMMNNSVMRKVCKDNFNSITAENESKPEQILDQAECKELAKTDNTQVAIKITPFEKIFDFAEANHIQVRFHTFVWYSQTPEWFFNDNYDQSGSRASRDVMLKRMENFIRVSLETVNNRWPGLVYAIDVVNEAVGNGGAGYNKNNKWFDTVGDDFVYMAFRYASQYKEEYQELYYNDYDYDYNTSNCEFALNGFLKEAIEEGLVDGVGIQGHLDSNANMENVITDAKMIYAKGLKCQVTELDITTSGTGQSDLAKQKEAYKTLMKRILEVNANGEAEINAMILWGITDDTSWKSYQNPLPFTSSFLKKPCYYGMLEAVQEF